MPANEHHELLSSLAEQLMNRDEVYVGGQRIAVNRLGSGGLRCVRFTVNERQIVAIEQNRSKPSRWGQLARQGRQVVQFQDVQTKRYLAVVVDGEVLEYGKH